MWDFAYKTTFPDTSIAEIYDDFTIFFRTTDEDCAPPTVACTAADFDASAPTDERIIEIDARNIGSSDTVYANYLTTTPTDCSTEVSLVFI
jgi:D-serine deaminase-like pyridoxal phosphate-dependent protein